MTEDRSLSPAASSCLDEAYPSSQKGGTLIVPEVRDLATHEARLCDPDGYRPACCQRCQGKVHAHECRARRTRNAEVASVPIRIYRCADREACGATWRILPGFLARWLQRGWQVIEEALYGSAPSAVPGRTRRRWRVRLASRATRVRAAMTGAAGTIWCALAMGIGQTDRRADLIAAYRAHWAPAPGWCLAELAEAIHRLAPGLRLM